MSQLLLLPPPWEVKPLYNEHLGWFCLWLRRLSHCTWWHSIWSCPFDWTSCSKKQTFQEQRKARPYYAANKTMKSRGPTSAHSRLCRFPKFPQVCCDMDLLVPISHKVPPIGRQMLFSATATSNHTWGTINIPEDISNHWSTSTSTAKCISLHLQSSTRKMTKKDKGLKTHLQNPTPADMLNIHSIC